MVHFKKEQSAKPGFLYLYLFVVALVVPFFFIDLPLGHSSRSVDAFFDLGHILFFMLFVRILAGRQASFGFSWRWGGKVLVSVLVIGILIEIVQSGLDGRVGSWSDVWRNLCGGILGLVWVAWKTVSLKQRWVVWVVFVSVAGISITPLCLALEDERRAKRDFPALSSFETVIELSRWSAKTEISRVKKPVRQGRYALRLQLSTDMYSGIGLKYFPCDWQGMRGLRLSVYNPEDSGLRLTVRVHDRQHSQGEMLYSDRFNRSIVVQPGWNEIFISMDDIKNGPQEREIDLDNISNFALFAMNLEEEKVIYIDDVRLVHL